MKRDAEATVDCPICGDENLPIIGTVRCSYASSPEVRYHADGSGSPAEEDFNVIESTCECWKNERTSAEWDCLRDQVLEALDEDNAQFDPDYDYDDEDR